MTARSRHDAAEADGRPSEGEVVQPSAARMYDFALGGKDNFAVDRSAVEAIGRIVPDLNAVALANRGFLIRVVEAMARLGVDQYIDLGTGIPTSPNIHEIVRTSAPDPRVVYVDNDPVVIAYNRALRHDRPGVMSLGSDLREPATVMDDPRVRDHLDFTRPIGLIFAAVLHFVDHERSLTVLEHFRSALPAGSYLAISVACSDGMDPVLIERVDQVYAGSSAPIVFRTTEQAEQLFNGFDLEEPGLVDVTRWRHDESPLPIRILSGLGKLRAVER